MNRVIITGADGFVGSHTVAYFLVQGVDVLALDLAEVPHRLIQHPSLIYRQCNVADSEELATCIGDNGYDTFIHFAWRGSAGTLRCDAEVQMGNALVSLQCMRVAKAKGCRRFVCAGSIMEYEVEAAIHSDSLVPPLSAIYSLGKLSAHALCKAAANDIGIELIWPVITNAYGVGEFSPRFINTTIRKIINNEPLLFTAATQNYDFVYITDVAKAFYLIAAYGRPFHEYIIGSGHAKPLKEFILELISACGSTQEPHFGDVPFSGVNLPLEVYDTTATRLDTGFTPDVSFADGVSLTKQWIESNNNLS